MTFEPEVETRPRILVASDGMEIGGIERSLIGLLAELGNQGQPVDLLLLRHEGELLPLIPPHVRLLPPQRLLGNLKTPIREVFAKGLLGLGALRLMAKARTWLMSRLGKPPAQVAHLSRWVNRFVPDLEQEYDIALSFQTPHDFVTQHVRAQVKVGWVHTDYTVEKPDAAFELSMWRLLDRIAIVSESVGESFATVYPDLEHKLLVVENTFDPDVLQQLAAEPAPDLVPATDGGILTLCTVGRYTYAKAFDVAIEACALLVAKGLAVRWYAVGYGPDEQALRRQVAERGLQDDFILTGKRLNPYPYIAACDIYVQPSRYEGKAVTVREALSLGKPVIITRFPTASSQLTEGVDGLVCENSAQGVADAVADLWTDTETREALAQTAASGDYSNRGAVREMLAELDRMVKSDG